MNLRILVLLIAISAIIQVLLLGSFGGGLEAIIMVPATAAAYFVISVVTAIVVKKSGTKYQKYTTILLAILINASIISAMMPTDGGIKPHEYLAEYIQAQLSRGATTYNQIYDEGEKKEPYKNIAILKFSDQLPDRAIVVHYYSSKKVEWADRARIVFEQRGDAWKIVNLSKQKLPASISVKKQNTKGGIREIFIFTINGNTFTEEYVPATYGVTAYYQSLDGLWKDGKPHITVFDWERG